MSDFIYYSSWATGILLFVYLLVRVGSVAYFRTKYAYLKATVKEMRKGDDDNGV